MWSYLKNVCGFIFRCLARAWGASCSWYVRRRRSRSAGHRLRPCCKRWRSEVAYYRTCFMYLDWHPPWSASCRYRNSRTGPRSRAEYYHRHLWRRLLACGSWCRPLQPRSNWTRLHRIPCFFRPTQRYFRRPSAPVFAFASTSSLSLTGNPLESTLYTWRTSIPLAFLLPLPLLKYSYWWSSGIWHQRCLPFLSSSNPFCFLNLFADWLQAVTHSNRFSESSA